MNTTVAAGVIVSTNLIWNVGLRVDPVARIQHHFENLPYSYVACNYQDPDSVYKIASSHATGKCSLPSVLIPERKLDNNFDHRVCNFFLRLKAKWSWRIFLLVHIVAGTHSQAMRRPQKLQWNVCVTTVPRSYLCNLAFAH